LPTPLKRHPALQPLSREHHQILLLGFKIRQGLKLKVNPERIHTYCQWFLKAYLSPHLEQEQQILVHVLGENNKLYTQLINNHQQLLEAFSNSDISTSGVSDLEEYLMKCIRTEERIIFEAIQSQLSTSDIQFLEKHLEELKFRENPTDLFWL
jgi:hypothetical protein